MKLLNYGKVMVMKKLFGNSKGIPATKIKLIIRIKQPTHLNGVQILPWQWKIIELVIKKF